MPRFLLLVVGLLAALAAAAEARAHHWQPGACGLPATPPLRIEFGEVSVSPLIRKDVFAAARPSLVIATSQRWLAEELRASGAHTVFWHMKLEQLIGLTTAPAEPPTVVEAADRLVRRAAAETGCSTPLLALNELQGAWVPTPWAVTNTQYRANALALVRRMHELGARPFLLVPTTPEPFVASPEAAEWWRQLTEAADVVLEVHFNGRAIAAKGPVVGNRLRRLKMRRTLERLTAVGVPAARLGLLHGFQSGRRYGGREGLPLATWLRVVKWEALAAAQVAAERAAEGLPLASDWSWGWGDFPTLSPVDSDKPVTACVYLWSRDPALCDGPGRAAAAGVRFAASRTEGQLLLVPGVECTIGAPRRTIAVADVERLAAVAGQGATGTVGRRAAVSVLFARTVLWSRTPLRARDVLVAEERIVAERFGGSRDAYAAALIERRADVELARGAIVDQLLVRRLPGWKRARALADALATATCARDGLTSTRLVDVTVSVPFLRLPGAPPRTS